MAIGAQELPGPSIAGVYLTQQYGSESGFFQVHPQISKSCKKMVRNDVIWLPYFSHPVPPGPSYFIPER